MEQDFSPEPFANIQIITEKTNFFLKKCSLVLIFFYKITN